MNLFRSEEHARNWAQFNPEYQVQPLSYYLEMFSREQFRARSRPDYISWRAEQQRQRG